MGDVLETIMGIAIVGTIVAALVGGGLLVESGFRSTVKNQERRDVCLASGNVWIGEYCVKPGSIVETK